MEIAWTKKIDVAGPGNYRLSDIVRIDRHTFITGTFQPESSSEAHCFVAAFDTSDVLVWHELYQDPDQRAIESRALIVQRNENELFDASYALYVHVQTTRANGSHASVVLKYSGDGKQIWSRELDIPNNREEKQSFMIADHQGNQYVIGLLTNTSNITSVFLKQIGSQGDIVNNWQFNDVSFRKIMVDAAGPDDIVVGGTVYGQNNLVCIRYRGQDKGFATLKIPVAGHEPMISDLRITSDGSLVLLAAVRNDDQDYDFETLCYDRNDSLQWQQTFNEPGKQEDIPVALGFDDSACIYVTGTTETGSRNTDIMTVKYDPDGNEVWSRRFVGKKDESTRPYYLHPAKAIHGSSSYNMYIYGTVGNDVLIIKYTSNGFLTWFTRIKQDASICIPSAGASHLVGVQAVKRDTRQAFLVKFQRSEQLGLIRWD